jgi:hypothetical protein
MMLRLIFVDSSLSDCDVAATWTGRFRLQGRASTDIERDIDE